MFGDSVPFSEDSLQRGFLCSDKRKKVDYEERGRGGAPEDKGHLDG